MTKNKRLPEKMRDGVPCRNVVPKGYRNGIDYLLKTAKEPLPEKEIEAIFGHRRSAEMASSEIFFQGKSKIAN